MNNYDIDKIVKENENLKKENIKLTSRLNELESKKTNGYGINIYKYIFAELDYGLIIIDNSGLIISLNRAAEKIFNLSSEYVIGRKMEELPLEFQIEGKGKIQTEELPVYTTLETGNPLDSIILALKSEHEKTKWTAIRTKPLYISPSDKPDYVLVSFLDITEQQKTKNNLLRENVLFAEYNEKLQAMNDELRVAYEELEKSERKFKAIFNNVSDAVGLHKITNGKLSPFLEINNRACEIFGYSREEFYEMTPDVLIPEKTLQILPELLTELINKGSINFETENLKKDGSSIPVEINALYFQMGQEYYISTVTRDISFRQESEQRNSAFWAVVENSNNIVVVKDMDLKVIATNSAFAKAAGKKSVEDLIGKTDAEIFGVSPDSEPVKAYMEDERLAQNLKKGQFILREEPVIYPDGSEHIVLTKKYPIYSPEGTLLGTGNISTDITSRIQAERELQKSETKLKQLNESKDKFFSIIAHDLKAPFTGFLEISSKLNNDPESFTINELKDMSSHIHDSANSIYQLLNELLLWSRTQIGNIPFTPEELDLYELVYNNIYILSRNAASKNIEINFNCQPNTIVFWDRNMMMTVFRNLIQNSIKFTNNGGKINIKCSSSDSEIKVDVIDTGIGMSKAIKDSLFIIGKKISRPGTKGETGTGLGLILCKEFIEKHSGRLIVDSEPGKGSAFSFIIPK